MFSGGRARVQWEQILDMDDIDATNVLIGTQYCNWEKIVLLKNTRTIIFINLH